MEENYFFLRRNAKTIYLNTQRDTIYLSKVIWSKHTRLKGNEIWDSFNATIYPL